jgi:hypothetical protein
MFFEGPKFETWNIMSLYKSDSLKTAARELEEHRLASLGVQKRQVGRVWR